jgi:hypothetical protein
MELLCAENVNRGVKYGRKILNKLYYSVSLKTFNLLSLFVQFLNILSRVL